jgi:Tol biopolymer transport system component
MSRSTHPQLKFLLAALLVFTLACDAGSVLPFLAPTSTPSNAPTQFPNTSLGPGAVYRPSPAGWIAFANQGNLWLIHPDGSGLKQITHNAASSADFRIRWSPDGKMVGYSVGGVLTILDISSLATRVRAHATAGGFDWSGNGEQIVYDGPVTSDASGKVSGTGLWMVDVQNGTTRQLLAASSAHPAPIAPQWSSDSSRIIFSEPPGVLPGGTHLLDLTSGRITDLVQGTAECTWAPSVLLIACMNASPAAGQLPGVLFLDQDGNEQLNVSLPAAHFHASLGPWSPDSKRLAILYTSDDAGMQPLTDILSIESADLKTLSPGRAAGWSSDARWIILEGSADTSDSPVTIVNTTSLVTSSLTSGSSPAWQPGTEDVSGEPTPSFCMDSVVGFVHKKPKGYFLTFCFGAQHYTYPSLEKGVYAVGGRGQFFVYVSNSGFVYAARMGDQTLTRVGNVRNFIAVRTEGMEPNLQVRFLVGYPDLVQVVEMNFGEKETLTLPRRITSP